ncbi:hypothetical protein FA13DRAFT_1712039 [Coprinellus micaceus]|uniref:Uncharacterized protein n=1 Tax=Coprinellus micaceus TaxID=71717 RepID=A0A4Y7T248_COPMI|nr:hypothetical protein FA13DRAFT_1712039 [Coprinellus micaceus]
MRITIPTYGVQAFDEDGAERQFRWVEMMKNLTNCVDMWTSRSRSSPVLMLAKSDPTQRSCLETSRGDQAEFLEVELGGTLGDVSSSAVTKHWPELATLDFGAYQGAHDTPLDLCVNQILQILGALPTLVRVSFHNYGYAALIPVLPIPITSPCLRSLTLTGADLPRGFAQSLHLPALRELRITPTQTPHNREVGSGVGEFLLRFGACLDSLSFAPDVSFRRALVAIYEALRSLENLSLVPFNTAGPYLYRSVRQPGVDCYALRGLNGVASGAYLGPTAGGSSRHPRLRRLELQGTMDAYIDDGVERELVDLITNRRRRPEGLNVLTELTDDGVDLNELRLELTYRDSHGILHP